VQIYGVISIHICQLGEIDKRGQNGQHGQKWGAMLGAPRPKQTRGGHDPIFYPQTNPNGPKWTHFMFKTNQLAKDALRSRLHSQGYTETHSLGE
jgi:hypothetical protein